MNLRRSIISIVFSCAALLSQSAHAPAGALSEIETAITKAIDKAQILDADYKYTVAEESGQLIVSTYINNSSRDLTKDCKVDAVLIAKAALGADSKILKTRVRFYDYSRKNYAEVTVSKNDVVAFESGKVTKDELLLTLDLTQHTTEPPSTGIVSAATGAASSPSTTAMKSALRPTDKYSTFKKGGIAFYYPKTWSLRDNITSYGDFAELNFNGKKWANIAVNLKTDEPSAEQASNDQFKYYWSKHNKQVIGAKTQIIGYQRNLEAKIVYIKDLESKEPGRFQKHVFFGYKNRIYTLTLQLSQEDYAQVSADFDVMLDTLCYAN